MKLADKSSPEFLAGHLPAFEHIDDVARWAISACQYGLRTSPRGQPTTEIFAQGFTLINPRKRLLSLRNRRWSSALAVGEFCWHLRGGDDVASLAYYAPIWKSFSDDGSHIRGSCYGKKIFAERNGSNSWKRAAEHLRHDKDTRRSIITVGGYDDCTDVESLDISCLQTLHFLIRESKLHLIVHMRSNDAFLGLPYDVFLFTMFQEMMCCEVNMEMGTYIHFADSMHVYERDADKAAAVGEYGYSSAMGSAGSNDDIASLLIFEEQLRCNGILAELPPTEPWRQMAQILLRHHRTRRT